MAGPYSLLHTVMMKAPALWDTKLYDSLSICTITQQVKEADMFLSTYCSIFEGPYSDLVEWFFTTVSTVVHKLPECLVKEHWKAWLYSPAIVKKYIKAVLSGRTLTY
ncbi:hypothetical protein ARMSODRAFT_1021399 [Armillaria solidipes]|uniref:Uncharacterized protein n=1 Tax=Armillaria solidipes TaxID=1076256 RepID=A0A2H3B6V1_9AGAR|nr:hypothetical protein ARMSODRAFT_1021399 [Armillaria solidipes]